ncbi:MAG: agmatine deiminase family protein [Magnetococcales bacterium]|nr:agmatine deiminase family protein [Magnetococcales bacterium]
MTQPAKADLIVLAAPYSDDHYYVEELDNIFAFHVEFAKQIKGNDKLLILTDAQAYDDYVEALGSQVVAIAPMSDIWMRDFSTSNPVSPVMFRYTAAGQGGGKQGQRDADAVQDALVILAQEAGLSFEENDLLNDGGNFVEDYAGNIVVSRKFLRDNKVSEAKARAILQRVTGAKNVALIEADEQCGLEHADGVVSFINSNKLIINSYPDDPDYAKELKRALYKGLPGVEIHEIITAYDGSQILDDRFGSACGLYTNALVTQNNIYLPQFGVPEDKIAIKQVSRISTKKVVPVSSQQVCHMGGGVRCMSWQLQGENATKLLKYFGKSGISQ